MNRRTLTLALLLLGASACGGKNELTDLYVSTEGNDSWSGRLAAPNSQKSDGPVATLERARNIVRELKGQGRLEAPVTVNVRGGKYYLSQPFLLESADSGVPGKEIRYMAFQGEKPVISGGRKISGWSKAWGLGC